MASAAVVVVVVVVLLAAAANQRQPCLMIIGATEFSFALDLFRFIGSLVYKTDSRVALVRVAKRESHFRSGGTLDALRALRSSRLWTSRQFVEGIA